MYIVYETTNLVNGKFYIGVHKENNSDYLGSGKILKQAIKKYGKYNFIRETLKSFDNDKEAYLFEKEIVNDNLVNNSNCYNVMGGGFGSVSGKNNPNYGKHHTNETKKKMSESQKGRTFSDETKKKMSEATKGKRAGKNNPNYGKHHSDETKKKMSDNHNNVKGKNNPMWNKLDKNNPNYGKKHTDETKKKMSIAAKGKPKSKESNKKNRKSSQQFIYYIKGNEYISANHAAENLNVKNTTIFRWIKNKNKPNCYRESIK